MKYRVSTVCVWYSRLCSVKLMEFSVWNNVKWRHCFGCSRKIGSHFVNTCIYSTVFITWCTQSVKFPLECGNWNQTVSTVWLPQNLGNGKILNNNTIWASFQIKICTEEFEKSNRIKGKHYVHYTSEGDSRRVSILVPIPSICLWQCFTKGNLVSLWFALFSLIRALM